MSEQDDIAARLEELSQAEHRAIFGDDDDSPVDIEEEEHAFADASVIPSTEGAKLEESHAPPGVDELLAGWLASAGPGEVTARAGSNIAVLAEVNSDDYIAQARKLHEDLIVYAHSVPVEIVPRGEVHAFMLEHSEAPGDPFKLAIVVLPNLPERV